MMRSVIYKLADRKVVNAAGGQCQHLDWLGIRCYVTDNLEVYDWLCVCQQHARSLNTTTMSDR